MLQSQSRRERRNMALLCALFLMLAAEVSSELCSTIQPACGHNCRQTPEGPKCYCNEGFTLGKDGKSCYDVNECLVAGICSQQCTNRIGSYECSCMEGYQLVNTTCQASGSEPILVFSTQKEIRAIFLRSGRHSYVHSSTAKAVDVDVDPLENRVYWTEIDDPSSVYSSKLDGTDFSTVLRNGLEVPDGIAVDYVGRMLYFTDAGLRQILACKMDGSMCHILHNTTIKSPRAIVVDPPEGLLYWSDWGLNMSGIYRSGMDGSHRITMVSEDIEWPNGMAIDHASNRLYWCDAKIKTIEYITLDGGTRKVLMKDKVNHPFSLAVFEDNLYWSDWSNYTVESCNKFTGQNKTVMFRENGKKVMGIHVYHSILERQGSNPCRNSSCSHICLIAPLNTYRCACPQGFNLGRNGRTCAVDSDYPMLLVNDESRIYRILPETAGSIAVSVLPLGHFGLIGGIAYDWTSKTLFVSDVKTPAIYVFNLTSLSRREFVRHLVVSPVSLAFDPRSGNVYWVDSNKGTVEVAATTCSRHSIIVTNLSQPMDIALVPDIGKMFVSTGGQSPSVWMYDMDGKNGKALAATAGYPTAIAVRPSTGLLYWADPIMGMISSVDYTNSYSQPKIVKEKIGVATSVAVSDESLYWTDSRQHVLHFANHSETQSHNITLPGAKSGMVARKVIYASEPESRRYFGPDCANHNGECSFLCLTSPTGHTCACPFGTQLSKDGRSCSECEGFTCPVSGECIPWSRVCDGEHDCADLMDEGPLCASSCNGSCVHKCQKTPQGPKCSCHEGHILSEDGVSCYDECDTAGRCSHFCNRTKDGLKCSCAKEYVLETNQRTCKVVGGEAYLAYLMKDGIRGLSLETLYRRVYMRRNFTAVIEMGYDAAERTFFWADRKEKTINSYSADTGQFEVLIATQKEPQLLRRDWVTKNVFYTTDEGSVVCCEGNGQYCTSVIKNISSHISSFDISPAFGFIFWSVSRHRDLDSVSGVIERANMDGSFRQVVVSDRIFLITGIAVDPVLEAIYWSDSVLGTIESTDFNGVQRRKVVDHLQYPISITVFEDSIYWADRATNSLSRCDKFSGKGRETLLSETTPFNSLLITHKAAQMQGENRCFSNNCPHICLSTRTSFACKCDDRNLRDPASCELASVNKSCPEDYCPESTTCVVESDRFVCKCLPHFSGEGCEKSPQHAGHSPSEPLWTVCAMLVVVCVCLLATSVLIYRRYRKSTEMLCGLNVQYVNTASFEGSCDMAGKVGKHENEYEALVVI